MWNRRIGQPLIPTYQYYAKDDEKVNPAKKSLPNTGYVDSDHDYDKEPPQDTVTDDTKLEGSAVKPGGWPQIWTGDGKVMGLQPLVFPAEPLCDTDRLGPYRVLLTNNNYHESKFRNHVTLPYKFNNFKLYVNEKD